MSGIAVGTVFAKNYLAMGRVLADSFRRRHPDVPFYALLSDEPDDCLTEDEPFLPLTLEDVKAPERRLRFLYSRQELATALKPQLLSHLLDRGFHAVVFLDPDILVLNDLNCLFEVVGSHSLTLTPHLLSPASAESGIVRELHILKAGVYNGGVLGVSETASARRFLDWWRDRMRVNCCDAAAEGVYFDQRWLDLAPVFFEDVCIYRHPGCNVAYWNLAERNLQVTPAGAVYADGLPCRCFHFSGYNPDRPNAVSRFISGRSLDDIGDAAILFRRYQTLLMASGYHDTKSLPYAYA
jgi:hypothetical protein